MSTTKFITIMIICALCVGVTLSTFLNKIKITVERKVEPVVSVTPEPEKGTFYVDCVLKNNMTQTWVIGTRPIIENNKITFIYDKRKFVVVNAPCVVSEK